MNAHDIAGDAPGTCMRLPTAEECRMVRAIALLALREAARHGEYWATFRGFRVHALRQCPEVIEVFVEVKLCVSLGKVLIERSLVATSDAGAMEPYALTTVISFE
jgi:hypothetical protein